MATSGRKNISFRFRKDSENYLQEEETENDEENLFDATVASNLQPMSGLLNTSGTKAPLVGSKWLNDSWKKFQQIVEEKKEKVSQFKDLRDSTFYRELDYISNDKDNFSVSDQLSQQDQLQRQPVDNSNKNNPLTVYYNPNDNTLPSNTTSSLISDPNTRSIEEPEVFFGEEIHEFVPDNKTENEELTSIFENKDRFNNINMNNTIHSSNSIGDINLETTKDINEQFLMPDTGETTLKKRPRSLSDRLSSFGDQNENQNTTNTPKDDFKRFSSLFSKLKHETAHEKIDVDSDEVSLIGKLSCTNTEVNSISSQSSFKSEKLSSDYSQNSQQQHVSKNQRTNTSFTTSFIEQNSDFDNNNITFSKLSTESSEQQQYDHQIHNRHNHHQEAHDEEEILPIAQTLNSFVRWCRLNFSWYYFLAFVVCTLAFIIFIQISPFSSFANGFLLGLAFMFFSSGVLIFYLVGKVFQRMDKENNVHRHIMSGEKWKKLPAFQVFSNGTEVQCFEGWFYELIYSKRFGIDRTLNQNESNNADTKERSDSLDAKARLVFLRLEGSLLRLFVPKDDKNDFKKPPLLGDDRVHFYKNSSKMVQHIYDLGMMKSPRISLWLPKNVNNRKKYLWMMKYPLILTIEKTNRLLNSLSKEPTKLVLFARTNRDKEEWYARFRTAIENCEQMANNRQLSSLSTPEEYLVKETTVTNDKIPRAMSLDMAELTGNDFEQMSNLLNFELFMKYAVNVSTGSNASFANNGTGQANNSNVNISRPIAGTNLLWFNALVSRIMFDFLTHSYWTKWVQFKIQRKLSHIRLPYFVQTLTLKDVNLGHSVPKFLTIPSDPILDEKGLWVDMEMDYEGCFTMTLETKIDLMRLKDSRASERELKPMKVATSNQIPNITSNNGTSGPSSLFDYESTDDLSDAESIIDLSDDESEESLNIENGRPPVFMKYLDKLASSKYFQQATENKFLKRKMEEMSNTPLLLTVTLQELRGILTINLPRPSSDRLWYGFRESPHLLLNAKPSLGDRVVSMTHITQWISKKLKQEFNKLLVVPNMDDISIQPMMAGEILIDESLS